MYLAKKKIWLHLRTVPKAVASIILAASALVFAPSGNAQEQKPNVLLIVLDDVGYSDLGAYGSEIETPNMDDLANSGVRFSNFHVTPTCSPTRAALLSGRDPHRVGMGLVARFDFGPKFPAFRGRIDPDAATIAQILQANDVSTYAIGKWHLTPPGDVNPAGPFTHWPLSRGFDKFYGFLGGSTDQFFPELARDNQIVKARRQEGYSLTTDLVDNAINMVHDHKSFQPDRPFFMYLATPGMHAPHQAPPPYLTKQRGKYDKGWNAVRETRLKRQKEIGLVPENTQLPKSDKRVKDWDQLSNEQRQAYSRLQEAYAGFLNQTDFEIGRLLTELEVTGVLENTIVIVVSDNGGSQEGGIDGSVNHSVGYNRKAEKPGDIVARLDEIGGPNTLPNYPLGWSQASNTPFPYFKQDAGAGGITVPFIVRNFGDKTSTGVRNQYQFASDLMPTILDMMEIEAPRKLAGRKQLPIDGKSMVAVLENADTLSERQTQFYRMGHNRGIYHDGWMATSVHKNKTKYTDDKWVLFNTENDFSNANDLAATNPKKLLQMQKIWRKQAAKVNAEQMVDIQNPDPALRKLLKKSRKKQHRSEYVYYPETSHAYEYSVPNFSRKNYALSAEITRKTGTESGVLFAVGNHDSGMVLYIENGKAVFEYNFFANVKSIGTMYRIESDIAVPKGKSNISVNFTKTKKTAGIATLTINGVKVGSIAMPQTIATERLSHEGMDIGRDANTPVGSGYKSPFEFEGEIERVTVKLGSPKPKSAAKG